MPVGFNIGCPLHQQSDPSCETENFVSFTIECQEIRKSYVQQPTDAIWKVEIFVKFTNRAQVIWIQIRFA